MNILVVHEVNYFEKPIYEFIEIPEALSLRGHKVTMVDYGEGSNRIFDLKTKIMRGNRVFKKAKVRVVRPGAIYLGDAVARLTDMFTSYFTLKRLFRKNDFDAVILYSVPTNGWQTVNLAHRHGVPVFFRTLDVLYKLRPFPFPIKQIVRSLEQHVYKNSDYCLALTPRLGRYCGHKDYLPLFPAVNDEIFHPLPKDHPDLKKLRKKLGIKEDDKIILFVGTFYDFGGLKNFIKNIKKIKEQVPEARLLLVGGAGIEKDLRQLAKDEGVEDDVIFTGFVPYQDVMKYANLATICINPFQEVEATRYIIPAKLFQYTACRKTIVCRRLKGIIDIVPDKKLGIVYGKTDRQLIDLAIKLLKNKKLNDSIAKKGYEYTLKHHSWLVFIDTLESYLKKYAKKH